MKIILKSFTYSEKKYEIFQIDDKEYLFYRDEQKYIFGLIQGNEFESRIESLIKKKCECLECSICDLIIAGISVDNGETVEFGLNREEANKILGYKVF